jgi:hypothetical protein
MRDPNDLFAALARSTFRIVEDLMASLKAFRIE